MIYAYFDKNRILKELINDTNNSGDSNVNKIAVYWEDDRPETYSCGVRFQLVDKSFYPVTATDYVGSTKESLEIPYNKDQDLLFFRYGVTYPFRIITIPNEVLTNETDNAIPVVTSVYFYTQDLTYVMNRFAFNVGPSTLAVAMDQHINLAEWNSLLQILANKQLYIVSNYDSINVADHRINDMFFSIDEQKFSYINSEWELVDWNFGLSFDDVPTNNSNNPVTSTGIYNWVLGQIGNLDFKTHICTNAADTPYGVTWTYGGTTVTGTLAASSADKMTIYLVHNEDAYDEYIVVNGTSWELLGSTRINLPDTPSSEGVYSLYASVNSLGELLLYSWKDENDWIITSSGTSFDLTDPRYKLKYQNELYYYHSNGIYISVSYGTIKLIQVGNDYGWDTTTPAFIISDTNSSSFTIGTTTYSIPSVAVVVQATVGQTVDYNLLDTHKDYLLQLGDLLYHFIGYNSNDDLCYSTVALSSFGLASTTATIKLLTVELDNGTVASYDCVLNKVTASQSNSEFTITIGGVAYTAYTTIVLTGSSGTLLSAITNPTITYLTNSGCVYRFVEETASNLIYKCDNKTITVNKTTLAWEVSEKKLYRYKVFINFITSSTDGSVENNISAEFYAYDYLNSFDDFANYLSGGKTLLCGETFVNSPYSYGLIRYIAISVESSVGKVTVAFYSSSVTPGTPASVSVQTTITLKVYDIQSFNFERKEV